MDQEIIGLKIKEWLLLVFVFLCVILILLVWWEGLSGQGENPPGFMRPTTDFEFDEDAYQDWNAAEESPESEGTATPTPAFEED